MSSGKLCLGTTLFCQQLTSIPTNEVGMNIFKGEYLQYCFALNTSTLQSLHMKVQPVPGKSSHYCYLERQLSKFPKVLSDFCYPI